MIREGCAQICTMCLTRSRKACKHMRKCSVEGVPACFVLIYHRVNYKNCRIKEKQYNIQYYFLHMKQFIFWWNCFICKFTQNRTGSIRTYNSKIYCVDMYEMIKLLLLAKCSFLYCIIVLLFLDSTVFFLYNYFDKSEYV